MIELTLAAIVLSVVLFVLGFVAGAEHTRNKADSIMKIAEDISSYADRKHKVVHEMWILVNEAQAHADLRIENCNNWSDQLLERSHTLKELASLIESLKK